MTKEQIEKMENIIVILSSRLLTAKLTGKSHCEIAVDGICANALKELKKDIARDA